MTGFALIQGVTLHIKFANGNSASNPTLNVNSTGAKPIIQYSSSPAGTDADTTGWHAGAVLTLTYDGSSWVRDQGYNTDTQYQTLTQELVNTGTETTGKLITAKIIKDSITTAVNGVTTYILSTGDANGQIKVTPSNGTAYNVSVAGLGGAAYKAEDYYATVTQMNGLIAAADALVFKGTLSGAATTTYTPTANCGWTYKVDTAGLINGLPVEAGDLLICTVDDTAAATSTNISTIKSNWVIIQNNVDGAVFKGTNAFVDGEVILADGTEGKVKSSGFTIGTSVPSGALFTDKYVSQDYSNANSSYPLLLSSTSDISTTNNRGDKVSILNNKIYANPYLGEVTATTFNGNLSGNASTASAWASAITLTIGATGKSVNGSSNQSWTAAEILGTSDTAHFYRGDQSWSDTISGGTLKITNNSNTMTIGSVDGNSGTISNSANIPFYFNQPIGISGTFGTSTNPAQALYIGTSTSHAIYHVGTQATSQTITFLDNTTNSNGNGIAIGGGGVTLICAGNAATSMSVTPSSENLYMIADGATYIYANANTLANRVGAVITTSGHILPQKAEATNDNVQNLGAADNRWANIYATNFIGTVSGNASTATSFASAQVVYVNLANPSTSTTISGGSSSAQVIGVNGTLGTGNGGTGNTSFTANTLIYTASATQLASTTSIYATTDSISINSSSVPDNNGKFQVKGTSTLQHVLPETNATYDFGDTETRWRSAYFSTSLLVGAQNTITTYNSNALGTFIGPGVISTCVTSAGNGYYLIGGGEQYGRLYINRLGTTSTSGTTILELGNNLSSVFNNSTGMLRIWSDSTTCTDIVAQAGYSKIFYLPKYNGDMYAAHVAASLTAVGSNSTNLAQPVYVEAGGRISAITTAISVSYGGTGVSTAVPNYVFAGPSSGNTNAAPTWRALTNTDLPTIAINKGGTNITSYTTGDILYSSATNVLSKLSGNTTTTRKFLLSVANTTGTAVAPQWDEVTKTDVGLSNVTNDKQLPIAGGTMTGALTVDGLRGTANVDYGLTLPSSPTEGQIFFQLSDPWYELPAGGTAGQALVKNSSYDRDVIWASVTIPQGGTTGQALVKTSNNNYEVAWGAAGGILRPDTTTKYYVGGSSSTTENTDPILFNTNIYVENSVLFGAAWNDYAEYRYTKDIIEPGRCVIEDGKDSLILSTERMQAGAEIVSDTYGFAIGQTEKCQTPIAISGRVLAYPYEDISEFKPGCPVCSGPSGTVSIMTEEEARAYPWLIVGTVSAIPQEDYWGAKPIKTKNRIWIRVR